MAFAKKYGWWALMEYQGLQRQPDRWACELPPVAGKVQQDFIVRPNRDGYIGRVMPLQRWLQLMRRRVRARRYGFDFRRAASFTLPDAIDIAGRSVNLRWPAGDDDIQWIFYEILLDDRYRLDRLRGRPIRSVLDVGAHIGLFTLAARDAFPDAVIHAYEPNRQLEAPLKHHAAQVGATHHIEALGAVEGRVSLRHFGPSSGQTLTQRDEHGDVNQVTFRQALERLGGKADLVKLDCEFAEWPLFEDAEAWHNVNHLVMEYHVHPRHAPVRDVDGVRRVVESLGFTTIDTVVEHAQSGYLYARRG